MTEIALAPELRGTAGPVAGFEGRRRARTVAPSQALHPVLGDAGIAARVDVLDQVVKICGF